YLKDEKALFDYLTDSAMAKAKITNLKDGTKEADLKKFISQIQKFEKLINTLKSRFDQNVLRFIVAHQSSLSDIIKTEKNVNDAFGGLQNWVKANPTSGITNLSVKIEKDAEYGTFAFTVHTTSFGLPIKSVFDYDLSDSSEWEELKTLWAKINQF